MHKIQFFTKKFDSLTAKEIADITGAQIHGQFNPEQKFSDIATLDKANNSHISFLNSGQYFAKFQASQAGCCLVEEKYAEKAPQGMVILIHKNPYFAYAKLAKSLYEAKEPEFVPSTFIHPSATIGEGAKIAPNAYVGKDVTIGKNCFIGPNASIMDHCSIGDNCTINANAVISFAIIGNNCTIFNGATIGQDGFGFAHDNGANHKIIQLGIVHIGNDVEIGANSCIDRGAIENTIISDGVKIDNLVQVGHNVKIGKGTVIAGSTALAGSCTIGNYVQIGGNSSISGHITIGDGAKIAGMSGVARDVPVMQAMAGIPAVPIRDWHKTNSKLAKLIKPNA